MFSISDPVIAMYRELLIDHGRSRPGLSVIKKGVNQIDVPLKITNKIVAKIIILRGQGQYSSGNFQH